MMRVRLILLAALAAVAYSGGWVLAAHEFGATSVTTLTSTGGAVFGSTTGGSVYNRLYGAAGSLRMIRMYTGSALRWEFGAYSDTESGSNAGSSFYLRAYNDAGSLIDAPLTIGRASGAGIYMYRPVTLTGSNNLTVGGDVAINDTSPDITTTATGTGSVFNANVGTLNIGGAANVAIGGSGKTVTMPTVTASQYRLSALNTAPASATATGTTGEISIDSGYIYVCTATNTWKRAALSTW